MIIQIPKIVTEPDLDTGKKIESVIASDDIANLDMSMLDRTDKLNLILQRSEILYDIHRSGRLVRAWSAGDTHAFDDVLDNPDIDILKRTAAIIKYEFDEMCPLLDKLDMSEIADIGCGYGLFDLFAAKRYGSKIKLIDIEESSGQEFGFSESGAAYTRLDKAAELLHANGIAKSKIKTINPQKSDLSRYKKNTLVVSFLACGFHFPAATYAKFFETGVQTGGHIMLDLRSRTARAQIEELSHLGSCVHLEGYGRAHRILIERP